jgi:hypothetical protein
MYWTLLSICASCNIVLNLSNTAANMITNELAMQNTSYTEHGNISGKITTECSALSYCLSKNKV